MLAITPDAPDDALTRWLDGDAPMPETMRDTWLIGTPDEVAAQVQTYVGEGITHFMLWCVDAPREDSLRLFAEQVMPRVSG